MEELYDILPKTYKNTLMLIKKFDESLYQKASKRIFNLPKGVLNKIKQHREFDCEGVSFKTFFERFLNTLEFQHTTYDKYFNVNMTINSFTEKDLTDVDDFTEESEALAEELNKCDMEEFLAEHPEFEDCDFGEKSILLFSLTTSNSKEIPQTHYYYLEKDGKRSLENVIMYGIEKDYAVFLEKQEDDYYLIKETRWNDDLVHTKKQKISYEELLEYVCEEDEEFQKED